MGLLIALCVCVSFYKWGLKPRPCAFSALTQPLRGTPAQSPFFWLFIRPMGFVLTLLYIWLVMYDCTLKHFPFVPPSILTSPFSEFESPLWFFLFLCHRWLHGMSQFMAACAFLCPSSVSVTVNDQVLLQLLLLIKLLVTWMSTPVSKKCRNDRAPLSPFCWCHSGQTASLGALLSSYPRCPTFPAPDSTIQPTPFSALQINGLAVLPKVVPCFSVLLFCFYR